MELAMKKTTLHKWFWMSLLLVGIFTIPRHAQAQSGITEADGRNITCASDDGRRHYCPVDTSRGVQMVRQRSGSPCDLGRTWGYDRRGIWVDRGCRADFVLGDGRRGGWDRGPLNPPPYGGGPGSGPGSGYGPDNGSFREGFRFTCSSDDGHYNGCPTPPGVKVRINRQISGSPCDFGRSWGYDRGGVWVDRGCRAEFVVTRR